MTGRFIISGQDLTRLNSVLSDMLSCITYIDTCSLGKTADLDNSLRILSKSIYDSKRILNKVFKIV